MQIILYALLNYMNCSIKQDTNYEIAKRLLLHIQDIENYTLEETAKLCHVSVSTLNRFCRIIGYKNFSTLRNFIKMKENESYLCESNHDKKSEMVYINKMNENMLLIEKIPTSTLERIANIIHTSNRIILLGFGEFQYPALYFQKQMLSFGKLVEIFGQINELKLQSEFHENDLIIITSIQGKFLDIYNEELNHIKCKKILLTQIKDENILNQFDEYINFGIHEDERLRKYSIMRIYEKILCAYYQTYYQKNGE